MTIPLWIREAAPLAAEPRPLPGRADVVIVGGGVAGVCVALHLARAGVDVVVLEATKVANRASGRNDGQVLLGLGEHFHRLVGQFGAERAHHLWQLIQDNNEGLRAEVTASRIDCDLRSAGGFRLAETAHEWEELQQTARLLAAHRIDHHLHDQAAAAQLVPSVGFHGLLELPGEAVVQPAAMVRGMAAAARQAGASFYQDTPVRAVTGTAGNLRVETDAATLGTDIVVHCTSALAPELDDSGFLQAQVFAFRGQILASDPLPQAIAEQFGDQCMSSNFCYEYFRLHQRRFVIGGMRWSVPGEEQGLTDDNVVNDRISRNLADFVQRHFPLLRDTPLPHAWTGIMAGTNDGLPLCGELPGRPGRYAFCAFNGYGLSFAFVGGAMLAQQIVHGRAEHPAAPMVAPRRFRN